MEGDIQSIGDGIWWATVTATTVGYGDIAPGSALGRTIAAILMIVGIGTIGMITGSVATYFVGQQEQVNPHINQIKEQLDSWDELQPKERLQTVKLLETHAQPTETYRQAAATEDA